MEASEAPPEDRHRLLADLCGNDAMLRAEVESLLAHAHSTDSTIVRELYHRPVGEESSRLLNGEDLQGELVGQYRLLRKIGIGGMGVVFLAQRDDEQFEKQVAVKVIRRGMETSEVLLRFYRERQILAALEHPYIARLMDGGSTADGRPYLVMELVDGQPIDRYCDTARLSTADRCRLFLAVCEAVSYAHRKLIVHRDLKPGNILITADGMPKLLDFGVAKILDPETDPDHTLSVFRPYTPHYASPEQIRGEPLSTGTDIYSLGVLMRDLLPAVPPNGDLDNILAMATRVEVDRRYASVEDLAADLRRYLESRPVLARPDSFRYRAGKFLRRRRVPVVLGSLAVVSIVASMGMIVVQMRKAEARLDEMISLSNDSIVQVASLLERVSGSVSARKELVGSTLRTLERLAKDAGGNLPLRTALAKAYLRLGELQGGPTAENIGDIDGALKSFRTAALLIGENTFRQPGGAERLGIFLAAQQKSGILLGSRDDFNAAIKVLHGALETAASAPADNLKDPAVAQTFAALNHALARTYVRIHPAEALKYARIYLQSLEDLAALKPDSPELMYDMSMANTEVGYDYLLIGDPEGGLPYYRKSLALRAKLVERFPGDAVYRRGLMLAFEHYGGITGASVVPSLGQTKVAREYLERARPMEEAALKDPENKTAASDYAMYLVKRGTLAPEGGEVGQSIADLREAISRFDAFGNLPTANSVSRVAANLFLGHRMVELKKYAEGVRYYQLAIELATRLRASHPSDWEAKQRLWDAECGLALALAQSGEHAGAGALARRLVQQGVEYDQAGGISLWGSWAAQANLILAKVNRAKGDKTQAQAAAAEAVRLAQPLATGRVWDPNGKIVREAKGIY